MKSFLVRKRNNPIVYRILNITQQLAIYGMTSCMSTPVDGMILLFTSTYFPSRCLKACHYLMHPPTHVGWIDTAQQVLLPFPSTPLNMCSMHGKHIPDGRVMIILDDTQKQG
ncbi:hypothetical protein TRV_03557 [Trichophyton verrucosum HKI 0517]|uniref:Uncharacterized protein n=1 Tax=Trichophyton verrucosum (strain HKI 0517) TaxID=663202 RepID=D4D8W9_TRIVH|nr:uncharacterized protein TRV_03557 [Trichophyton verrucosum HKI 0517]EFE41728.1 hypothetical protein TRV_03557 [Trichophyton verrucosum HKI 0517]